MDEHRTSQRQRILKAGTILFDRGAGIDCTVRNFSDTGLSRNSKSYRHTQRFHIGYQQGQREAYLPRCVAIRATDRRPLRLG
jgi:hypothetical protein